MGARKNGAREGDMRGERELPLSSIVSPLRVPSTGYNHASSFSIHSTSSMFSLLFVIKSIFFQILNYKVPSCHSFPRIHFLTPGRLFPSGGESAASKF